MDWGDCNQDASRVREFFDYYITHVELPSLPRSMLGELILASINESLLRARQSSQAIHEAAGIVSVLMNDIVQSENLRLYEQLADHPPDDRYPIRDVIKKIKNTKHTN